MIFNTITILAASGLLASIQAAPSTGYSSLGQSCAPGIDAPCEEPLICMKADEGRTHRCMLPYRPLANDCTFNACSQGQVCVFDRQTFSGARINGVAIENGQCYNAVVALGQRCGRGVSCVAGSTCVFGQTLFGDDWGICTSTAGASAGTPPTAGSTPATYPTTGAPSIGIAPQDNTSNGVVGQLGDRCDKSVGKLGSTTGVEKCAPGLQCKFQYIPPGQLKTFGYVCSN